MLCSKFFQVIVTIKICQGLTLFFSPSIEIFNICGWYSELFSESPRIGFLAIHRGSKSLTKHCCSEWLAAPHLWDSHYKQWMCNDYKYVTYLFLSSKIINQYLDISILVHCFPILTIFFYGVGQFLGHREKKHHSKPWNKKKHSAASNSSRCMALELRSTSLGPRPHNRSFGGPIPRHLSWFLVSSQEVCWTSQISKINKKNLFKKSHFELHKIGKKVMWCGPWWSEVEGDEMGLRLKRYSVIQRIKEIRFLSIKHVWIFGRQHKV